MSDNSLPVLLNQGLDLVSPPLLAEAGALIGCLNYETTGDAGYRRLDGYERYDGFPDGGVAAFLVVELEANVPADQAQLVNGSVLSYLNTDGTTETIGVVVDVDGTTVNYIAFRRTVTIHNGDSVAVLTPSGNSYLFNAVTDSVTGRTLFSDAAGYVQQLRDYSSQLRALVMQAPSAVAGLNYSRDRLYEAVDAASVRFKILNASLPGPLPGATIRWKGKIYTVMSLEDAAAAGDGTTYTVHLAPTSGTATASDAFVEIDSAGAAVKTYATVATAPTTSGSKYAVLGYANNPEVATTRGFTYLSPAAMFSFDAGSFTGGGNPPSGIYYAVGSDGAVLEIDMKGLVQLDGSFTDGDATGRAQAHILDQTDGTRNYLKDGDVIHSEYPTTGSSAVLTIDGDPSMPLLAGTGSLRLKNTRYQWGTYNFLASAATYELYGTNGVFRAFWATPTAYGNIVTQDNLALDNPKYISFHAGNNLALGFSEGSVQLSVGGEPYNYNGVDGALEIGTGDNVTGLLEASGDSTLVFGKRSIRRITGTNDATLSLKSVVSNAGALDYTAVNVANKPVFCDPNGVSTLEQTSAYGDFAGERATYKISTWLFPKLVPSPDTIEIGGVACAFAVRKKNQYRLFLNSGEVVSICFTTQGPICMLSDYALQTTGSGVKDVRTPLAWSSEVDDNGREQLHVVWDRAISQQGQDGKVGTIPDGTQPYRLDYGWGYDGKTFAHHFDTAHVFMDNGSHMGKIVRVRMHGLGYGLASLNLTGSSIETNFDQPFQNAEQDISMPPTQEYFYDSMSPVTSIIDQANWGLGIKLRVYGKLDENTDITEPSHVCQVLVCYLETEGALDY